MECAQGYLDGSEVWEWYSLLSVWLHPPQEQS